RRCARVLQKDFGVEPAQEVDRLEVLTAAEAVRDPSPGGAAVIEVEHGRDRIDPQRIDAIALEPKQRVRHKEIRDLDAPEIVNEGVPIEVAPLHRMGVLVERGAVEM